MMEAKNLTKKYEDVIAVDNLAGCRGGSIVRNFFHSPTEEPEGLLSNVQDSDLHEPFLRMNR
jgi:hypothetical protein